MLKEYELIRIRKYSELLEKNPYLGTAGIELNRWFNTVVLKDDPKYQI